MASARTKLGCCDKRHIPKLCCIRHNLWPDSAFAHCDWWCRFRFPQHGKVMGGRLRTFTSLRPLMQPAGYAIGLHQSDQGVVSATKLGGTTVPVFVAIQNITYRNITGNVMHAGQFECSALTHFKAPCEHVLLEHVHLNASIDGCKFEQIHDIRAPDVSPQTCAPSK